MANTAFDHVPALQVPSSTTTNGLVTWDANDGGGFLSSASTLTLNNGVLGTLLQLTVDNLRFDGRAISSLDTDGNITITPNGAGTVVISKTSTPTLLLTNGTNTNAITLNTGTTAANYTITLPAALPGASGKILQSSGVSPHSVLVWADAGAANQNAWTTITRSATGTGTAAGDASVAATTTTDSLDLVAGDNITITGDSSNQKYTIAAAGGGAADDYFASSGLSSKDQGDGLHIKTGDSGGTASSAGNEFIIEGGSGNHGMSILGVGMVVVIFI